MSKRDLNRPDTLDTNSNQPRPRRPYAAPAIEEERTLEVVTLGTQGPKPQNPGMGC
jgi:hypothetical protein